MTERTEPQQSGSDVCPFCEEYLALKRRAESPEAAAAPLRAAGDRPESTFRERIAAALFEQHLRIPWAMAYPADRECYGCDADAFLAVRDAEMAELRRQAELADAVTAETKRLLERRTTRLRERAEPADSGAGFVRGFRLHLRHGRVLDGAEFPNGRVVVMDDPEWGLCSGARTADLLTVGYPDSRIEWAEDAVADASEPLDEKPAETAPLAHPDAEQQASGSTGADDAALDQPQQPTGIRGLLEHVGIDTTGRSITVDGRIVDPAPTPPQQPETGLPAEQPCADPRHTGAIREQLGCSGPDPATT
ncbi:hypothetical protein [Streptomyces sp. NBC_00842]|uniref:hypothetical protein n=1 Tax=Streptomyces sp. NBC_00842 TaxID=2975848 RepID=UPI0038637363|nr:hypothetical protein OH821_21965 [Streptomyces sp. NBC_00842]